MHRVSVATAQIYGKDSPFYIPHTLYRSLAVSPAFGPSLAQTCALSGITGYRIEDWLAILGIDLLKIAGLQATLPLKRTRMMDPIFERTGDRQVCSLAPFGHLRAGYASPASHQQLRANERPHANAPPERRPLFARIGREDSFAYPELLPGSLVRLKPPNLENLSASPSGRPPLLMIEHERGFWCGRFYVKGSDILCAASSELAFAQVQFQGPREARIVGQVDLEIRWINRFESPRVTDEFAVWQQPLPLAKTYASLGSLIHRGRSRAGLTLEAASLLSGDVSRHLKDKRYSIAQSTLSDYEAGTSSPRHLEKVITLCLLYGIALRDYIATMGIAPGHLGQRPMSERFLLPSRTAPKRLGNGPTGQSSPTGLRPVGDSGQIPWFLAGSLEILSGIARPSVRDLFYLADPQPFLPAGTEGAFLALVDRRKKRPVRNPGLRSWEQPAWVLLLRNGEYRCACCSVDRKTLVLYPESDKSRPTERLRLGSDVEVIGQLAAVARRVS